ncbi:Predicted metal-binding protein [Hathewaya proteolytica DSM 3090]|uniref:Predicted metal-binding protein n=1 Tax=Hathewaya proteolytica DSM 3090 TaxID=1121331 RepID=A0A1M6K9U1_9CLOT|nr:CGGC domain-containing protein [Hathewaya proteolytica]SHJ55715.1 Predicted metal-binding protein [Hathewaya proteolytica DSM 3090]
MKRIAILTCLKSASSVCTGAGCFKAVNQRRGTFEQYREEEIQIEAFFQCNGCHSKLEEDKGMEEKLQRIIDIKPDAVHVGICTMNKDGKRCETIEKIINLLEESHIKCISGTH